VLVVIKTNISIVAGILQGVSYDCGSERAVEMEEHAGVCTALGNIGKNICSDRARSNMKS